MENDNSQIACAQSARGGGEIEFADFQRLPAHQSRVPDPADHRKRKNQIVQARAKERDHGYGQQNAREGKKNVKDKTGEEAIHPSSVIARYRADDRSYNRRDQNY